MTKHIKLALICAILGNITSSANAQWVDPNLAIIYDGAAEASQTAKDDIDFWRIQEDEYTEITRPDGSVYNGHSYDDATEAELTMLGDVAASNYRGWTGEGITVRITDGTETVKDKIVEHIKSVAPDATTTFTAGSTLPEIHTIFFDSYYNYADYLSEVESYNATQDWLDAEGHIGSPRKEAKSEEVWTTLANDAQTYELMYPFTKESGYNHVERSQGKFAVVAAGNDSALCNTIFTCNKAAVMNVANDEASTAVWVGGVDPKDATIVAGALNKEGTALADYSNHAGILKDNFLVTTISPIISDWNYKRFEGTEYAAAQVAGAAALIMEKYGITQGQTIKQILLNSADDLGEPGVDDVYGHGALNIGKALSPYGTLN